MEEIVFPNQIRINRKMRGVSMQDLADRLGISLSAISKIGLSKYFAFDFLLFIPANT